MLLGALIDAGANRTDISNVLTQIPKIYPKCRAITLNVTEVKRHGFRACSVNLKIDENSGETNGDELLNVVERIAAGITPAAKSFALKSARTLLEAESRLHGVSLSDTHLHEAGSTDTIADIVGVAVACESLQIFNSKVYTTPVAVGGGITSFSHGKLTTPVPAVLEILKANQIPIIGGPEPVEVSTPTGVSMLVNLAGSAVECYPTMLPEKVGYGAGAKELSTAPNILRVVLGRALTSMTETDSVQVLETNLDDLSGEILGHTLRYVLDAGARDAWITPAQFKKDRPGNVLHVLCEFNDATRLAQIIMQETGTLGVRMHAWNRVISPREVRAVNVKIEGESYNVRVKVAKNTSGKISRIKPEFDDAIELAKKLGRPVREILELIESEAQRSIKE